VPGAVGGHVAESVLGKVGFPSAGQREGRGQPADSVGGLGAPAVPAQGDSQAAGFEDVDVRVSAGGVSVGAAAGVPAADPDAR